MKISKFHHPVAVLILVLLSLSIAWLPAQAQAVLIPPEGVNTEWVTVDYHRVNVDISNQIAITKVSMQFTNTGEQLAEGQFIFPLPMGATVENLMMFVNGVAIEAKILKADEARNIYNEIVRQMRDPALLEYIGRDLLQANVFPIPPQESRQIEIQYGQVLEQENGLIKYAYPLDTSHIADQTVGQMSIRVSVTGDDTLGNVYSPSHRIALSRPSDSDFVAGFEQNNFVADNDFTLYYGVQRDSIDTNLLTYKESANEDGFFMLMIQPPMAKADDIAQAKDVIVVLDQSGSMDDGVKWQQAQDATVYVLQTLNPNDRFNVIPFSTGYRLYANELLPASEAPSAIEWVKSLYPEGGTNIHDALANALKFADAERPLSVIFMTDGLATEGIIDTQEIINSLNANAPQNARIFSFGVGNDVDTFLLDSVVRDFGGTSSYVRPNERIDEEVAALFNKISAPVLNDVSLTFEGVTAELLYPQQLSDLFAGEQLTLVGRYRNATANASITLSGKANGQIQTIVYNNLVFSDRAGGEDFIARLWATRRIGDFLNQIRLNGENQELVDSVVALSIRYGIITPYTSFLITEDDILSQDGLANAQERFAEEAQALSEASSGASAVDAADMSGGMANANAPAPVSTMVAPSSQTSPTDLEAPLGADDEATPINPLQQVGSKTFIWQEGVWTDTTFQPDSMTTTKIVFLSDAYFALLDSQPSIGEYLALGEKVIVVLDGTAYEIISE
jgi:Ca-activated chloride channel family protein